MYNYKTVLKY